MFALRVASAAAGRGQATTALRVSRSLTSPFTHGPAVSTHTHTHTHTHARAHSLTHTLTHSLTRTRHLDHTTTHTRAPTSFLEWRRSLASLSDLSAVVVTPFERNLEFWRQLWRVIERRSVWRRGRNDCRVLSLKGVEGTRGPRQLRRRSLADAHHARTHARTHALCLPLPCPGLVCARIGAATEGAVWPALPSHGVYLLSFCLPHDPRARAHTVTSSSRLSMRATLFCSGALTSKPTSVKSARKRTACSS